MEQPAELAAASVSTGGFRVACAELAVPTPEDALRQIAIPTLVAIGEKDERSDADELAGLLPDVRVVGVSGDHGSAFAAPELTAAIAAFLAER